MKTALVTGAAGFVGRHLVPKLLDLGYEVTEIDSRSHCYPLTVEEWSSCCKDEFDIVIHLAANIENIEARNKGSISSFQDIVVDYRMAQYLEAHPPKECAIWMTSCATDCPDVDTYSHVKLNGERLALTLKKRGIPIVILRPYSGYGSDQSLEYPFPAILKRAMQREDPLTVWGSGRQIRDFIHVDDLTDAILHFTKRPDILSSLPIPIGTGRGINFLTLARMMADAVGYTPEIRPLVDKPQGGQERVASIHLAAAFGWKTEITLEEGIQRAIKELRA